MVIWIGGRPGESVPCGRSTGVKLVVHDAEAPALLACTRTSTFVPAVCGVTVRSARPSPSALTARCGITIAAAAAPDAASETCAPLTVCTITCVGVPRFGVGFETVAEHETSPPPAAVVCRAVGDGVGVIGLDDGAELPASDVVTGAAAGGAVGEVDAGATADVADVARLAHAVTSASTASAPAYPAARARDRDPRARFMDADATSVRPSPPAGASVERSDSIGVACRRSRRNRAQ